MMDLGDRYLIIIHAHFRPHHWTKLRSRAHEILKIFVASFRVDKRHIYEHFLLWNTHL